MQALNMRTCSTKEGYHYYSIALYETKPRVKDGIITWRFIKDLQYYNRAFIRCRKDLPVLSSSLNIPIIKVRHGDIFNKECK